MNKSLLIVVLLVASCGAGCRAARPASPARLAVFPHPPEYRCRQATGPIVIDGDLGDPGWAGAAVLHFVVPKTFQRPQTPTEARILYDREYLYLSFRARDEDIWFVHTKRDEPTNREDVVEAFFWIDEASEPYYEFEFNANEVIWDGLFHGRKGAGGSLRAKHWNSEGTRVAVRVRGTVNDWQDRDEWWTCEVAIPLRDLTVPVGRPPRAGDRWRINLARYDYSVHLPGGQQLSSCAPLGKVDFHLLVDFLPLVFE